MLERITLITDQDIENETVTTVTVQYIGKDINGRRFFHEAAGEDLDKVIDDIAVLLSNNATSWDVPVIEP